MELEELTKQLALVNENYARSEKRVELVKSFLDSNYEEFCVKELKKYIHLMPYLFILVQAILTRKVPTRIQEIRLLTLTMFFHAFEIKSQVKRISRITILSMFNFCAWLFITPSFEYNATISLFYLVKFSTLLGIVIVARILVEEKKLGGRRFQFREYVLSRINTLDSLIILANFTIYFMTPSILSFSSEAISLGTVLSLRAVIKLIECGLLFANFRLKGCDIDKNDMIGLGLTILAYANTFDYKPTSICPISFAVYYVCIGLYDKIRDRNEVRVPAVLEVLKMNETVEVENVGQKTVGEIIEDGIISDVRVVGEDQTVVESQVVGIGGVDSVRVN